MQIGFYFDQTRCTGCCACQVACKDWHDVPAGNEKWIQVGYTEKGRFPNVFVNYTVSVCWHCRTPVCLDACPVAAISKRKADGVVLVDSQKCIGGDECGFKCRKACPYNAPQFGEEENAPMRKCDFCIDRLDDGKLPSCVETCPTRALDAGNMDELNAKYQPSGGTGIIKDSKRTRPAAVFRAKPQPH